MFLKLTSRTKISFPLEEMNCNDALVNVKGAFCFEKSGEITLAYLPVGTQNAKINLQGEKTFSVKWFSPREGGEIQDGTVASVQGKGFQELGNPPADVDKDWVVVIR